MGSCADCETEIDDQYKYCVSCNNKRKTKQAEKDQSKILSSLSAINNNLYCIRRQFGVILAREHNTKIEWDKKKKDFIEKEI